VTLAFPLDPEELERRLSAVRSWDDWEALEQELFRKAEWPTRDLDALDADLARPARSHEGRTWEPQGEPYDLAPELRWWHERARWRAAAALDPEAAAARAAAPEAYGAVCRACGLFTREPGATSCPGCGREPAPFPLEAP